MNKSFYVVLPSNASYEYFPDNKLHSYKTKIPKLPINNGSWEVGMTEIQYPARWPNIIDGKVWIKFANGTTSEFRLHDGYYPSVDKLMSELTKIFNNAGCKGISVYFDELRDRSSITVSGDEVFGVTFSENILQVMGFEKTPGKFFTKGIFWGDFASDINDGLAGLFVYTDIVERRLVGDVMVPLLRVVPGEPSRQAATFKSVSFQNVQYVPVASTHTDSVEVNIRRDDGRPIPFEKGKVSVTLHFRLVSR